MITWNEYAEQSLFDAGVTASSWSFGNSATAVDVEPPEWVNGTTWLYTSREETYFTSGGETVSDGSTVWAFTETYSSKITNSATWTASTSYMATDTHSTSSSGSTGTTGGNESGATQDAGGYSSSGVTYGGDSNSTVSDNPQNISGNTTTTSTYEYDYTTTSTYEDSISIYSSTSTSTTAFSSSTTTTSSTATTCTTSVSTTFTGSSCSTNAAFTSSNAVDCTSTTTTSFTTDVFMVEATVVSAEATDWLWSFNATPALDSYDTVSYVITDIAASFTIQTFQPFIATSDLSLTPSPLDTDTSSASVEIPASTSEFTVWQMGGNTDSSASETTQITTTYTSGDMFPRDTTTTTISWFIYISSVISGGYTGATVYGDNTIAFTTIQSVLSAVDSTFLSQTGFDFTTTELSVSTAITNTYEITITVPTYFSGASTSYTSSDYRDGVTFSSTQSITEGSTASLQVDFAYTAIPASMQIFQYIPASGGMKTPDAMDQSNNDASNISADAAIYYPFTASVVQNIIVPYPTNTSTVQVDTNQTGLDSTGTLYTNVTNWSYQWNSFSLSYTSATSTTSSTTNEATTVTYSVWDSASHSGSFLTDGTMGNAYQTGNTALGGFSPISTASETGVIVGALKGFRFDTLGDSVSSSIVYSTLGSTALSESVFAGLAESMFMTGTNAGGSLPYIGFTR